MSTSDDFDRRLDELVAMKRWSDVIRCLADEAERTSDIDRSVALRTRLARIARDVFSNQAIAIEHLTVVVRMRPEHPSRDELVALLVRRRDWRALERLVGSDETERLRGR